MPRGGAKCQNLGHCLNKFFALYLEDCLMYKHDTLESLQNKWVTVTYISWFSDFALYLKGYLMYKHDTLG